MGGFLLKTACQTREAAIASVCLNAFVGTQQESRRRELVRLLDGEGDLTPVALVGIAEVLLTRAMDPQAFAEILGLALSADGRRTRQTI